MKHCIYLASVSNKCVISAARNRTSRRTLFSRTKMQRELSIRFAGRGPVALSLCTTEVQLQPFASLWLPAGYWKRHSIPCRSDPIWHVLCAPRLPIPVRKCNSWAKWWQMHIAECRVQARQGTSCEIDDVAQSAAVASSRYSIPPTRCNIHAIYTAYDLVKLSIPSKQSFRHGWESSPWPGFIQGPGPRYGHFPLPQTLRHRQMVPEAPSMWRNVDSGTD